MLNEGIVNNDASTLVKSEMVRQLRRLGKTTPELWEAATFEALTGGTREQIDWDVEDNQAGYYLWIKGFDALVNELVDDGYALIDSVEGTEEKTIRLGEVAEEGIEYSQLVYPDPQA